MKNRLFLPLYIFLLVWSGTCIGVYGTVVMLKIIALGAKPVEIGMVRSLDMFGNALMVIPAGLFIEHYGTKQVYAAGALLCGLVYFIMSRALDLDAILLISGFAGAVTALRFISMNTEFLSRLKSLGKTRSGLFRASHQAGIAFVGPITGAWLLKTLDFKATLLTVSAAVAGTLALSMFVLAEKTQKSEVQPLNPKVVKNEYHYLLKHKKFMGAVMSEGLSAATNACFSSFIILIGIKAFGLPREKAVLFLALQGAILIGVLALAGKIFSALKDSRIYLVGMVMISAGLIIMSTAKNTWAGICAVIVVAIGNGLMSFINFHTLGSIEGEKGRLAGIHGLFSFSGMMVGPILGGWLALYLPLQSVFLFFIPLFTILAVYIIRAHPLEAKA